jgi:DNA helicase-2/ATP-dependent DNA helicase PcrA
VIYRINDIEKLNVEELVNKASDVLESIGKFSAKTVLKTAQIVGEWNGIKWTNEQLLCIGASNRRLLIEAGPGTGKTTVLQGRILKDKIFDNIRGEDILVLAYNKHTADEMRLRQHNFVSVVNKRGIDGKRPNGVIFSCTFHVNAVSWIKEYPREAEVKRFNILEDILITYDSRDRGIDMAMKQAFANANVNREPSGKLAAAFIKLYDFMRETLWPEENIGSLPGFKAMQVSPEVFLDICKRFERYKEIKGEVDFIDVLVKFRNVLKVDSCRERIQKAYSRVYVDEYQDFTPLLSTILSEMISEETYLTVIGDGDQSIYGFRGTRADNCAVFETLFPGCLTLELTENRRSGNNIIAVGNKLIKNCKVRTDKVIRGRREGGEVAFNEYLAQIGQMGAILKLIRSRQLNELSSTVIAYRNRKSSNFITYKLLEEEVPFRVGSGYMPFTDTFSVGILDAINLLLKPKFPYYLSSVLFKLLPLHREDMEKVLKNNKNEDGQYSEFWKFKWGEYTKINGLLTTVERLRIISDKMSEGRKMRDYFKDILEIFNKYYWNYQRELENFPTELEDYFISLFDMEKDWDSNYASLTSLFSRKDKFERDGSGILLTTFHGLKGLEFENVVLMDVSDSMFDEKESENYTDDELIKLLYVAVTRTKERLTIFFDGKNSDRIRSMFTDKKDVTVKVDSSAKRVSLEYDAEYDNEDLGNVDDDVINKLKQLLK